MDNPPPPLADQSAFPSSAPFSTWISPNNFGDFHPNPLMSLLTGNGQIEYPVDAVSRIDLSERQQARLRCDTDYVPRYGSRDPCYAASILPSIRSLPRVNAARYSNLRPESLGDKFLCDSLINGTSQACADSSGFWSNRTSFTFANTQHFGINGSSSI